MKKLTRIRGYAEGTTLTAVQYNSSHVDGEWLDERFGEAFILDLAVIGSTNREEVLTELKRTFWEGVHRVEYIRKGQT